MKTAAYHLKRIAICMALLFVFFAGFMVVMTGGNPFRKTDRSNCVVVADTSHFTGEKLLYSSASFHRVEMTTMCESKDIELDGGDGNKTGRVRWFECLPGPDCDEIAMY